MKRRKRRDVNRIDDLRVRFDAQTKDGTQVGLNISMFAENGYLRGVDSLVFHTVGLHTRGMPEIVVFLGPRNGENPVPEGDAVSLSQGILSSMKHVNTVADLIKQQPGVFLAKGVAPRRFMRVPLPAEGKNVLRYGRLAALTAYYDDAPFDFILYEPSPWIH